MEATQPDTVLTVGEIRLDSHNIFSEKEIAVSTGMIRVLRRTMNALHVPTRPWVIRQELLLNEGDVLDWRKAEESARNLRVMGILNRVEIAPVDTTSDGRVDLVVSSHETWTLGLGFNFALASSGALRWNLAMTEKNFLGLGTVMQASLGDDLNARYGRFYLRQNRFLRTPLSFEVNYDVRSDGHSRWLGLSAPFRTEDQTWSFMTRAMDSSFRTRWYLSNAGPAGSDPTGMESLYAFLPRTFGSLQGEIMRRVSSQGYGRIWRLGVGLHIIEVDHDLGDGLFTLADERTVDLGFLNDPGQPMLRDRGREVWPHMIIASLGRRWTQTRFLFRYGNVEDVPLDVSWEFRVGPTGSRDRLRAALGLVNWDRTGESFWLQSFSGFAYFGSSDDRNHQVEALLGHYRRFGYAERPFTLKTFLEAAHGDRLRGDQASVLGLDRGLRTLDIDGMAGDRLLRWSTEIGRILPFPLLDIYQIGWGIAYSGGLARWHDEDRGLREARHEIGAGLRFGSVRSGTSDLARFDVTYDLTGRSGVVLTTVSRGFF